MKMESEKFLKKGIKLNDLLYKECVDRLSDFNDVKESLDYLSNALREIENETRGEMDFFKFHRELKSLSEHIEEVDRFRMYTKINTNELKSKLDSGEYSDEENLSAEQLQTFQNQTQYLIDSIMGALDALKPIKNEVDSIRNISNKQKAYSQLMEDAYVRSGDAQAKIEQIASRISKCAKKGSLHDVVMADSLFKSDIDLLKKEANKR